MEEKIIEAKFGKNIIAIIALVLGICLIAFVLFMTARNYEKSWLRYDCSFGEYFMDEAFNIHDFGAVTIGGILMLAASGMLFWAMGGTSLTVTDKRVTGTARRGRAVDLPINQISSVSLGIFRSLGVASNSGIVHFLFVENREDIRAAIIKQVEKNQPQASTTYSADVTTSNADELRKYKELLDSGVISQEEFDAKKKQLLGL